MRKPAIRMIPVFLLILAPCRAQISDTCTSAIISPAADRVVQMLQTAGSETDAAAKQSGINNARRQFSQTLVSATTFAPASVVSAKRSLLKCLRPAALINKSELVAARQGLQA